VTAQEIRAVGRGLSEFRFGVHPRSLRFMTDVITTVTVSNGELGSYRPTAFNKPMPRLRDRKLKNCRSRPPSAQGDARLDEQSVNPCLVPGTQKPARTVNSQIREPGAGIPCLHVFASVR
jgi:hypothetical protein